MSLARVFDASIPPLRPFPGCDGVAGYIGGNTPHIWTAAEWNNASNDGELPQLPIWVGFGEDHPTDHGKAAAKAARALGWAPHHGPPGKWRAIVADMEFVQEESWLEAFGNQLQVEGFLCWPYFSTVALPSDPPGYQIWLAQWDGIADVPNIHDVIGHQYRPSVPFEGTTVDLSAFDRAALDSFGHGPRR